MLQYLRDEAWAIHLVHHSIKHTLPMRRSSLLFLVSCLLLLVLTACGGSASTGTSNSLASKQVLSFANVGITDLATFDPSQGPDANSALAVGMVLSGLVRSDKNLNVIPDQATWKISSDNKIYTFYIKQNVTFSDGTPVTAQTYVDTWTRALLPSINSPIASFYEANIAGAGAVSNGKAKTVSGLTAVDAHTLQVKLTQPTPYFLEELTNSVFFPLNMKLISQYGQKDWVNHISGSGVGTGPFMITSWQHNVKMVMVPNPHYYGNKTRLTEVDMYFVKDQATAFKAYRAGQYDFIWNLTPSDQAVAQTLSGFTRVPLLQSDLLFFDSSRAPFDNLALRQAFAYATDKKELASAIFKNSVTPAQTIIPPGMPGYQPNYAGIPYDPAKAKALFQSVYPDVSKAPTITFTYPSSQVTPDESAVLQQMWQSALGIQVKMQSVELSAYNTETSSNQTTHAVEFGFTQWSADYPDPYDWLALNLTSNAPNNNGGWKNTEFDQTVAQAETMTGEARIALYNKAEQIAITNVGWLPLDHQAMAAVIPSWLHGVSLNANGLFFDDWSGVSIQQH